MTPPPKVEFYALTDDTGTPGGLLRRTLDGSIPIDESLRRDFSWQPSEFLRKYELGHNDREFIKITAEEAARLIEHWRIKWAND